MAIQPNLAFGPIGKAIDLIVQSSEKDVARQFTLQRDETRDAAEESRFRRSKNLQAGLNLLSKKDLDPESRGAIGKAIPGLISDPDASLEAPTFQQPQMIEIGPGVAAENNLQPGTKLPAAQANILLKRFMDKRKARLGDEKFDESKRQFGIREKRLGEKTGTTTEDKAEAKELAASKKFVSDVNAIAVDVKAEISRKSETIEGILVPKEGEQENVEALQIEIEDLQTVERVERGFETPESREQVREWFQNGYLGKNGKEKAKKWIEDFDL